MTVTTVPPYVPGHGLLAGKTVVVTAAAGTGIGSVARRAIEEGASVLISDFHERRLEETADRLDTETGTRPLTQVCNVTDEDHVQALVGAAVDGLGGIDVMINNAGLGGSSLLVDMTDDQWNTVLDVTLNGTFRCTRAVLRHMIERGQGGAIVNNASILGAPHGVRINAVAPSLAMHPFLAKVTTDELLDELTKREAFGRYAEPWEVANVMVFLASDYSSYMTGEVVPVSSQRA